MQVSNVLAVVGGALVLWSVITYAGGYIADEPLREHGKKGEVGSAARGAADGADHPEHADHPAHPEVGAVRNPAAEAMIVELTKQTEAEPNNADRKTELGYALLALGLQANDAEKLIDALKQFDQALILNPNQKQALLGIAGVSLRVGVLDKAEEYYSRYVALEPTDVRALSDYGLTLVRAEKFAEAEEVLNRALKADPKSVPAMMIFAMLERERGREDEAKRYGALALETTSDPAMRQGVENFLEEFEPATVLSRGERFFRQHPIVGPKVAGVEERDGVLTVVVVDFPVSQMPDVAKQRFVSTIQAEFASLKDKLKQVDIVDQADEKVLMTVMISVEQDTTPQPISK